MGSLDPVMSFMGIPWLESPVSSPSGSHIGFLSTRRGPVEPYVRAVRTGEIARLSGTNLVQDVAHRPILWGHTDEYLFVRVGDDERQTDIHSVSLDGESKPVVEEAGELIPWEVDPSGRYLYFYNGDNNTLYRQDVETGARTTVVDYPGERTYIGIGCVSPDGEHFAYSFDGEAAVADADGRNATPIAESDGDSRPRAWHSNSQQLLIENGALGCGIYDTLEKTIEWIDDSTADTPVGFIGDGDEFFAHDGGTPVFYDRDQTRHEYSIEGYPRIDPWAGSNAVVGDRLLFVNSATTRAAEICTCDRNGEVTRLVEPTYGALDPEKFVEPELVDYEAADGQAFEARLYDSGERPSAAVVIPYGGSRSAGLPWFQREVQLLVKLGYTVMTPGYRFAPLSDDEHADFAAAGRWLRTLDRIDEGRVAVYGHSHGGYNAYMQIVTYPDQWAAGIAFNGKTDLLALEEEKPSGVFQGRERLGDPHENADEWRRQSPISHAENLSSPLLMLHGSYDWSIPVSQARRFREELRRHGKREGDDFEYYEFGDEGHASRSAGHKIRAWRVITEFLDRHV